VSWSTNLHVLEELAEPRIGIDSVGVNDDASCAIGSLDPIDDRHVIRIARAFKPVMLDDHELLSREGLPAVHSSEAVVGNLEIRREPPGIQPLHRFRYG